MIVKLISYIQILTKYLRFSVKKYFTILKSSLLSCDFPKSNFNDIIFEIQEGQFKLTVYTETQEQ